MHLNEKYKIIAIGSSAGGLYALSVILEGLPSDYPVPVVIVQHRSKNQNSLLEDVLQKKCMIKIKQADEKEIIESGFVYIAPPDYHLLIESDRTFSLSSEKPENFSRPSINALFETAAIAFEETLIGIILTGSNDDGAGGILAIKTCGGLTIAQHPEEAKFPLMPEASIATKAVQHVWSLKEIKNFLLSISNT